MTHVVKTSTAHDFLALVPQLVGFPPVESIVFVAFRGRRTCGALRYDLPAPGSERFHRRIATSLVGMLSKLQGVDAVVPVVYTGRPFAAPGGIVHADFVAVVLERFEFSGFVVRDALCVAADAWGSYLDEPRPGVDGRPTGSPLSLIAASTAHEAIPESERPALGDIAEWVRLPTVDLETKELVGRHLRLLQRMRAELVEAREAAGSGPPWPPGHSLSPAQRVALAGLQSLDDLTGFAEYLLTSPEGDLSVYDAAMLILVVRSPALRDVVMLQWAFDEEMGEKVLDDACRFRDGEPADQLETGPLMMGEGPRPDGRRVEAAILLLKAVVARAPRPERAPLLCMLAWLHWALGRSTVAGHFVDEAVAVDPDYGLAEVLSAMLHRGYLPEWAFAIP
jgi:hypothetical protein